MKLSVNGRFLLQDVTGVQRVAIEFIRALDALLSDGAAPGLEVTVWVPRGGVLVTPLRLQSVEVRREGRLTGHLWEQIELPRLAARSVLLCLGNTAPVVRLITRQSPTYTMVHDLSYKYFPSAYSRSFRWFYNVVMPIVLTRSTHIFTVSASEEASILHHYPRLVDPHRVTAVQNGGGDFAVGAQVSSATTSLKAGAPDVPAAGLRPQTCLYVGSLTKRKNGDGLMRAAVELTDALDIDFVIVGSANTNYENVNMKAADRGEIVFLGQVNKPELIEELYRQAKVFVFPSFYEASPLPPVEAMSFGSPVICSDIRSLRERCGDAAIYCDPADVTSIVTQVTRVLTDENLWQDLQRRGLAQAARFTWKRQVETVLSVLSEM